MKNYVKKEIDDGDVFYRDEFRRFHRTDGPAVEWLDGLKEWYIHGKRHRINGPAIQLTFGVNSWYINGLLIFKKEVNKLQNLRKLFKNDELLNFLIIEKKIVL